MYKNKCITSNLFTLSGEFISYRFTLQYWVVHSTTEAEYIAITKK